MSEENSSDTVVGITLGDGADFVITRGGELHVIKKSRRGDAVSRINLGSATVERFQNLQDYLRRISIHAVDAPMPGHG